MRKSTVEDDEESLKMPKIATATFEPKLRKAIMITELQALILGAVQGLTEFLPVSSSAHLVLVPMAVRMERSRTSPSMSHCISAVCWHC